MLGVWRCTDGRGMFTPRTLTARPVRFVALVACSRLDPLGRAKSKKLDYGVPYSQAKTSTASMKSSPPTKPRPMADKAPTKRR